MLLPEELLEDQRAALLACANLINEDFCADISKSARCQFALARRPLALAHRTRLLGVAIGEQLEHLLSVLINTVKE